MRFAAEHIGEGKLAHRLRRRLDNLFIAVAQRRAPQPGEPLDIALALVVIEIDAAALVEDQRPHLPVPRQIGVGMQHRLDVAVRHVAEGSHALQFLAAMKVELRQFPGAAASRMSRPSLTIVSERCSGHKSRIVSLYTPQVRMSSPRSRHFAASALAPPHRACCRHAR